MFLPPEHAGPCARRGGSSQLEARSCRRVDRRRVDRRRPDGGHGTGNLTVSDGI